MIARIWNGKTPIAKYEKYTKFLLQTAIPDYRSVTGNMGLSFLRNKDQHYAYFTLITYWNSIESIKSFAGEDYEKAKYYPEDNDFLVSFEENVQHFEVFSFYK